MDKIYAVDKVEGKIVVLEELSTKEKKEVDSSKIPNVKEGNVVVFNGTDYKIDKKLEEDRKTEMKNKLERLKNLKK
ncbi:MAG: DUF3006 domain-containing protein [Bacilli bacterium]|nr:DUF3006 domain-containing protein [Bacilli bacterium]